MEFKNRKERATWELNGCKSRGPRRKTLKISTPGDFNDDFQMEVTQPFLDRMDEMRVHLTSVTVTPAPPRTKLAAAIVEAAWRGLRKRGNIKKFTVDYERIREYDATKTPLEKLRDLSEHLSACGVKFPSNNGPSAMTATLRVLIECAYDDMKTSGSFKTVRFDYAM